MRDRLIGGFFVALITLITLISGGYITTSILAIVSIIGIWEYLRIHSLEKTSFAYIVYVFTIIYYAFIFLKKYDFLFPVCIVLLMVLLARYVFHFPRYTDSDVSRVFFSFVYVSVLMSYILRIRQLESGIYLTFYLLIASWGNDVFAYFIGRILGKHKLSPKVSPNKSIEGFIGGIIGAFLIGLLYGMIFPAQLPFTNLTSGVVAAVAAITSVIGDLAASAIKRNHDIKDYSHLIPGHGGILDRFDSVIYIAPVLYWLIEFLT